MRQAGIIAAGALYALRHHHGRLAEDHANAARLVSGLAKIKGLEANPSQVETNMVRFRVQTMPAQELVERLKSRGVLALPVARDMIRAVTNLMVTKENIDDALAVISDSVK